MVDWLILILIMVVRCSIREHKHKAWQLIMVRHIQQYERHDIRYVLIFLFIFCFGLMFIMGTGLWLTGGELTSGQSELVSVSVCGSIELCYAIVSRSKYD